MNTAFKFRHVKDMTPEERAQHDEIMAMLSPKVLVREQIRETDGDEAAEQFMEMSES